MDAVQVQEQKQMQEQVEQKQVQNNEIPFESHTYSADIEKVMGILVNSIYENKDIFIREVISNASDAINKACAANPMFSTSNSIKISYSKEDSKIIIDDTGCGMTRKDLVEKIGSIGTSGTKQFAELVKNSQEKMIGQFGVGFYSVYLVSKRIQIITRPIDEPDKIYEWVSESSSSYKIRELNQESFNQIIGDGAEYFTRGTRICLSLKQNEEIENYLEQDKLIKIIETHSSYIDHPIYFEKKTSKYNKETKEDETETSWVKLNWVPLWKKEKSTLKHEDYVDFYLNGIKDNVDQLIKDEPVLYKHFNVEGKINFTALLYFPLKAPFNLFEPSKRGQSLKLYTKNVLISADHKDLYPAWMEFVKGVVETSDIELNVSRQTVQNTSGLKKIRNQLTKKVIDMMEELLEDEDSSKYLKFYKEFSCSIKNGIHEEFSRNGEHPNDMMAGNGFGKRMMKLLKFNTSKGRYIGFDDYVKDMKPDQKGIYYLAGDKKEVLALSPFMEKLNEMDMEVFYFEEPIDEYLKGFLKEYICATGQIAGAQDPGFDNFKEPDMTNLSVKTFVDIARDKLLLPENENDLKQEQYDELCSSLGKLYESIGISLFKGVIMEDRFIHVPAIIVNQVHLSAQLEKQLKNNAHSKRGEQYNPMFERKNMLLSKRNKISQYFYQKLCVEKIPMSDPEIIKLAKTVYTSALIAGGYEPDNAFEFVRTVNDLLCEKI